VEIRTSNPGLEFGEEFNQANTYALHRIDLRPPLELLRKGFHKDCIQRKITRAEREGLAYESGRSPVLLRQLYGLLQMTRSRHQLPPQPIEWFENVVACMGKDACIRIALKGETPIAGIMTLDHGKTMVYKYGGSNTLFNSLGATPMLFWRAIMEAKDAGMEELDLGRSDNHNTGLVTFKDRWAAARSEITNWRAPAVQGNSSREQLKVQLVQQACAWIPDRLLNVAGRLLYRHIG
jgi:lipid II:glycine glycyltransferase (peptidoglycan interpeptide bridge formation enzyme)